MTHVANEQTLESARLHHQAGRFAQAESLYEQILAGQPNHPDALHLLGMVRHQTGRGSAGLELIQQAIRINPQRADYHGNLGLVLAGLGRHPEAIESYQHALALQPDYPSALNNLGNSLRRVGRFAQAAAALRRAIELRPDYFEALSNLGGVLSAAGDKPGAIAAFRQASALRPDSLSALRSVALACRDGGEYGQAADALRRSLPLDPRAIETLNNLGTLLKDLGRLDEALECFDKAMQLDPACVTAHSNRLYTLWFHPDFDGAKIFQEHQEWNRRHVRPLLGQIRPHDNLRDENRRLKIGYVSPDLCAHPVGRFFAPLLTHHDHAQFEIFCYSSLTRPDSVTARLRLAADQWRDVAGISDEKLAGQIRDDRIDILIDLSLHMADHRLLVFARKPAPVQATYLAYCGTSGLETIDYRLADPYLDPPDQNDQYYSEKSICLPRTYWCYEPSEAAPEPAGPLGPGVTFGCLNNFCKISSAAWETWIRLLQAVPNSRLLIHAAAGDHRNQVLQNFATAGLDAGRIEFVPLLSMSEYFRQYAQMDVALDPFPYCGGTTTCDALWMGVPVTTLRGRTAVGRGGVSILSNLGLTDLIADNPEEYVSIAAKLAGDLARRAELRGSLRTRMRTSPLMDAAGFARDVESAYRQMWRQWVHPS